MAEEETVTAPAPVGKKELMEQVGKALTERRKLRKLSISDISQALKIRTSFIEALESGRWNELPGEVYIRGFAVRYAQYLGLNGRELISPYLEKISREVRINGEISPQFKKTDSIKSPWVWVGVGVLFFAGLVKFLKPTAPQTPPAAVKPAPKEEKPATPAAEAPKMVLEKHRLDIFTPEQLWLRVKASDKMFEGFIPEGSTWTFSGEGQFDIRMGHTRNVGLVFDGRTISLAESQRKILLPDAN